MSPAIWPPEVIGAGPTQFVDIPASKQASAVYVCPAGAFVGAVKDTPREPGVVPYESVTAVGGVN